MIEIVRSEQEKSVTADYIKEMGNAVDGLCIMLSQGTKEEFKPKDFFERLHVYIENNDRLLYTNITNYIFGVESEEEFGVIQTNLDSVINYMFSDKFNMDFPNQKSKNSKLDTYGRTKRTVLKIWDHINLARRQYSSFMVTNDDYTRIVEEKMQSAEVKLTKEMNSQLISLVGIFTALSFLVFGGISSLDNIFLGVKDIPIIKLVITGSIWCFCIMNLVFMFMFFVGKMTKLDMKSTEDVNANLVQKYPLICWCNFVVVTLMTISCWIYYIQNEGFSQELYEAIFKYSNIYFIGGTFIICTLIGCVGVKLYRMSKQR